jgi:hypothetical protein
MSTATENLEAAVIVAEVQLREAKWKAEECKAAAEVENAKDAKCLQASLRIPTKPATHSNRKPATDSDLKPAGIPI